ncbi:MAG: hypothetical protein WBG04_16485 [Haloferula sp.]
MGGLLPHSNWTSRDTDSNTAGGKISGHNSTGSNDASIANIGASSHNDTSAKPNVTPDHHVDLFLRLLAERNPGDKSIIGGSDENSRG